MDDFKDYLGAFLGFLVTLISIIFIPEIKNSKKRLRIAVILLMVFGYLGIDKIYRDRQEKAENEKRRTDDSKNISSLGKNVNKLIQDRNQDSLAFANFSKKLETKYHIIDSANEPVLIKNYNTHIYKAEKVIIGGD